MTASIAQSSSPCCMCTQDESRQIRALQFGAHIPAVHVPSLLAASTNHCLAVPVNGSDATHGGMLMAIASIIPPSTTPVEPCEGPVHEWHGMAPRPSRDTKMIFPQRWRIVTVSLGPRLNPHHNHRGHVLG